MTLLLVDGSNVAMLCNACRVEKPAGDFYGKQRTCKGCQKARNAQWARDNPERRAEIDRRSKAKADKTAVAERVRRQNYRQSYGITIEQYDEMLAAQGGLCAICRGECPTGKRLGVDHCHETGKVRGLLCKSCNTGIGSLADSIECLEAALAYLREYA